MNHDEAIETSFIAMTVALEDISRHDCDYLDEDRPTYCNCPGCLAKQILKIAKDWRFLGAAPERMRHNIREYRMVEAWKNLLNDEKLANLLRQEHKPSVRDWFVATTIIQWLGTNVGLSMLDEAGFKYTRWEEDKNEQYG